LSRSLAVLYLFLGTVSLSAQSIINKTIPKVAENTPLVEVLDSLSNEHNARFFYLKEWLATYKVAPNDAGVELGTFLANLLSNTDLYFLQMSENTLVFVKDPNQQLERIKALRKAQKEGSNLQEIIFGDPYATGNQNQVTLSGKVLDDKTGDVMPFAVIQINDSDKAITTDDEGHFELTLDPGVVVLNVSFVDFEKSTIDLSIYQDGEMDIYMTKRSLMLDEIVVRGDATNEVANTRIGKQVLSVEKMKNAPAFFGEVDLVKQIQLLPGVSTVGEAASGFNVRGGSVDQNLILYDGLPIYNSAHVFGFLNAFNSEAIRNVSFYNGGIPAQYGGRASSVLDIQAKEGNLEKWTATAGIGLITGNLAVEGPIIKNKSSISATLRSTYSDWLVRSFRTNYADLRNSSVDFYDGTIKYSHVIDEDTRLSVTGYTSNDAFNLGGDTTFLWSNYLGSVNLSHLIGENFDVSLTSGFSSYNYKVMNEDPVTASTLGYQLDNGIIKADFTYRLSDHLLSFGTQMLYYGFSPGKLYPNSDVSNANSINIPKQNSLEYALYFSDQYQFSPKLSVEAGLRLPVFLSLGPQQVYGYQAGQPRDINVITDTLSFSSLQTAKAYIGLEPRLSIKWMLSDLASFKLGYNRMHQYLHLISNTAAVNPVDIWQPSDFFFEPQRADQISIGYFKDTKAKAYNMSLEVYYKYIENILDFKDGAQLILNPNLETELLQGSAYSYGVETAFSKNNGKLTGSLNYTYSRVFRVIDGPSDAERINDGNPYPANFDQPHVLNLNWKLELSRRHYFTGIFTYQTGRPVTIPLSAFNVENTTVAFFSSRNQFRIPDYHRLDLAFVIDGNHKKNKFGEGSWTFSVYNVYSRRNPFTVFFQSQDGGLPRPFQLSIIGTILPSVSYNIRLR
jgi:hypothetical protein